MVALRGCRVGTVSNTSHHQWQTIALDLMNSALEPVAIRVARVAHSASSSDMFAMTRLVVYPLMQASVRRLRQGVDVFGTDRLAAGADFGFGVECCQ